MNRRVVLVLLFLSACGGVEPELEETEDLLRAPDQEEIQWRFVTCPIEQDADAAPVFGPLAAPGPAPDLTSMCNHPFISDRPPRYLGPGDIVPPWARNPGFNGNIPRGSIFTNLCSPLNRNLCVLGSMYLGFFPWRDSSACHALARETNMIVSYYQGRFWDGYPRPTCEGLAQARGWDDLFWTTGGRRVPARPNVRCSRIDFGGYDLDDLRGDILSSNTLRELCQREIDAGFFN